MSKKLALASGGALIAAGILLIALGTPASDVLRVLRITLIFAFVLPGTIMQIYGTWPRSRRHQYFSDDVWMGWRGDLTKPEVPKPEVAKPEIAKLKAKPKSVASSRRGQTPNTDALPLADNGEASTGRKPPQGQPSANGSGRH
jgi:hypothetical protein